MAPKKLLLNTQVSEDIHSKVNLIYKNQIKNRENEQHLPDSCLQTAVECKASRKNWQNTRSFSQPTLCDNLQSGSYCSFLPLLTNFLFLFTFPGLYRCVLCSRIIFNSLDYFLFVISSQHIPGILEQTQENTWKLYQNILMGTAVFLNQFSCACPTVISSISGKSFHFPFPYFV